MYFKANCSHNKARHICFYFNCFSIKMELDNNIAKNFLILKRGISDANFLFFEVKQAFVAFQKKVGLQLKGVNPPLGSMVGSHWLVTPDKLAGQIW